MSHLIADPSDTPAAVLRGKGLVSGREQNAALLCTLARCAAERQASLFAFDTDWRVTWANETAIRVWSGETTALPGQHLTDLFPGIEQAPFYPSLLQAMTRQMLQKGESADTALAGWHRWEARPLGGEGVLLTLRGPSRRRQAEDILRQREKFIEKIAQAIPDLLYVYDLQQGCNRYANREAATMLGYSPDEVAAMGDGLAQTLFHPDDLPLIAAQHQRLRLSAPGEASETTYRVIHKKGDIRWLHSRDVVFERDAHGEATLIVGVAQDITERRAIEQEKEQILADALARADRDPLTGLYNHRTFHHRLHQEVARAGSDHSPVAVVAMDIDSFKYFNDTFGHLVGDDIICRIAEVLRRSCRETDIMARVGGDEFALIMPGVTPEGADAWVSRLRATVDALTYQPDSGEPPVPFRLSVGVATFPEDATDAGELIYLADKRAGDDKSIAAGSEPQRLRQTLTEQIEGFSMLDALVVAVDNKDRYTRQHSEDVMHYAARIARAMGFTPAEVLSLQTAALVHDVGKIGVPNRLLRHPGSLSAADYEAIKRHPSLGGILVAAVPELAHTLDAVRFHHERWDGGGYPDGLAGEAIPLSARVLAVADAYSAMTATRPYRRGLPVAEARARLVAGAGSQWDSRCVAALVRVLDTDEGG